MSVRLIERRAARIDSVIAMRTELRLTMDRPGSFEPGQRSSVDEIH